MLQRWIPRIVLAAALVMEAAASHAAARELPEVPVVEAGPTVDGALADGAWQEALTLRLGGYCNKARRAEGEKPKDATEARVMTDRQNLYVGFRCEESYSDGPWVYRNAGFRRRANSHVMGGDYVAVAIDMGRFGFYNYYMFVVNPSGELYKCFTWPHRYDLVLRDLGLPAATAAAKVDKAVSEALPDGEHPGGVQLL